MKLSELLSKDVINEAEGLKLGRISNLEIDIAGGKITKIMVKDGIRILNVIKFGNTIEIPWNKIQKIGNDVVIVDYQGTTIKKDN